MNVDAGSPERFVDQLAQRHAIYEGNARKLLKPGS
jgi:hypothetical protein